MNGELTLSEGERAIAKDIVLIFLVLFSVKSFSQWQYGLDLKLFPRSLSQRQIL